MSNWKVVTANSPSIIKESPPMEVDKSILVPTTTTISEQHDQKQQQDIVYDSSDSSDEGVMDSADSSTEERFPRPTRSQTKSRKRTTMDKNTKQNVNYKPPATVVDDPTAEVRKNKLALMRFSDIFQREEEDTKDDKAITVDNGDIILGSEDSSDDERFTAALQAGINRSNPNKKQKLTVEKSQQPSSSSEVSTPKNSASSSTNSSTLKKKAAKQDCVLVPNSALFRFVCSCSTVKEIRYELQEDFEDEKHVSSRKKHNMKSSSRKGRLSTEEVNFIRKYYNMSKDIRIAKYHIPLNKFKNVESLDDGIIRTKEF
ncbi:predicted protein [Naegleria gruberi]|uniref:Predicted protein n=1 Tax=Naegleria gruberi TaxID=5762 RepID=D2VSB3_NAEGR|nr:uncharacterized protein NAEGRDRAFT_51866 [Naegleria gruberi]EFC40314.1 predicted protein [Naegleria gruberi]|eukprot:XP_002673058.1 predicted protein [Naegleria gruberi strain NEG-M]